MKNLFTWRRTLLGLAAAGITADNIHGGGLCTISDPSRFFSHRRSASDGTGHSGRMATLIWREDV